MVNFVFGSGCHSQPFGRNLTFGRIAEPASLLTLGRHEARLHVTQAVLEVAETWRCVRLVVAGEWDVASLASHWAHLLRGGQIALGLLLRTYLRLRARHFRCHFLPESERMLQAWGTIYSIANPSPAPAPTLLYMYTIMFQLNGKF